MKLSSVVIYAFTVFVMVFIVLLLLSFLIGKITGFGFFTYKNSVFACFVVAGIVNTLFLMFVFVSKVVVVFWVWFALMGAFLLLARRNAKIFYAGIPIVIFFIMAVGFTMPISVPVTNDIVAKKANCAYTLKSSSEDMAIFCGELMNQYSSGDGAVKEMFSPAVNIDMANSWGLGIAIEYESEGETYWHSGINPGFQSLFVLYPLQDKYVLVLTNSDNGLLFAKKIAKDFLEIDGYWEIARP